MKSVHGDSEESNTVTIDSTKAYTMWFNCDMPQFGLLERCRGNSSAGHMERETVVKYPTRLRLTPVSGTLDCSNEHENQSSHGE